jgi:hypothetical protein
MARLAAPFVLLALAAAPAAAAPPATPPQGAPGQVRFVEELRVEPGKDGTRIGADLQRLSANRFVKVGMEWERDAKKRLVRPHFKLLDLSQRRIVDVAIPLDALPREHVAILGQAPPPELVHHDGQVTSMIFGESRNYKQVAKYLCQYDHRAGRFSELVRMPAVDDFRFLRPLGFDPQEQHLYFAIEAYARDEKEKKGPASLELFRVRLEDRAVDWELTLDLPKRARRLQVKGVHFSHDGSKLALVEHNERSYPTANPPQRVYVVDVPGRRIAAYPAPVSAYGAAFSRDDRFLLLGSNELGELSRIDLAKGKVDLKAKGHGLIHAFVPSPSGRSFLVFANTILSAPKVVEVRSVDTLALKVSIPVRLLFPGQDGISLGVVATEDGRTLVGPIPERSGFPAGNGVRIFELPDDVDSPAPAGTSPEALRRAQGVVAATQHAAASRIELGLDPAEEAATPAPTFSPVVVAPGGDVILTGTRSGNSDGDYKPGRTTPVVVRLDAAGRKRWEVSLAKKGFLDHTGARVAATADGGCIAQVFSYVDPGRHPVTRLVKLDAKGRTAWEVRFRGDGGLDTPLTDRIEQRPDGTVALSGRIYPERDVKKAWSAEVSPEGKVLSDIVGE